MAVSYGYFNQDPKVVTYHRSGSSWEADSINDSNGPSKDMVLSLAYDKDGSLYCGTAQEAYHYPANSRDPTKLDGVLNDSAVQGMAVTDEGVYLASCRGLYHPTKAANTVRIGSEGRMYDIAVNAKTGRMVKVGAKGVYTSSDNGKTWMQNHDVPSQVKTAGGTYPAEYRSIHMNDDGTVVVSGNAGTFIINPFAKACSSSK
jgi:hypothetical protein